MDRALCCPNLPGILGFPEHKAAILSSDKLRESLELESGPTQAGSWDLQKMK